MADITTRLGVLIIYRLTINSKRLLSDLRAEGRRWNGRLPFFISPIVAAVTMPRAMDIAPAAAKSVGGGLAPC